MPRLAGGVNYRAASRAVCCVAGSGRGRCGMLANRYAPMRAWGGG